MAKVATSDGWVSYLAIRTLTSPRPMPSFCSVGAGAYGNSFKDCRHSTGAKEASERCHFTSRSVRSAAAEDRDHGQGCHDVERRRALCTCGVSSRRSQGSFYLWDPFPPPAAPRERSMVVSVHWTRAGERPIPLQRGLSVCRLRETDGGPSPSLRQG
jgi:hypothetical protein